MKIVLDYFDKKIFDDDNYLIHDYRFADMLNNILEMIDVVEHDFNVKCTLKIGKEINE